ncbi:hypothetical protein SteCoe_17830 [Stentor coeruleus]|uniref:Uncharacterized protein n=1 Tax=Stentor coeruleus TaxID=5963 RepID=A0A1R2BYA3_9CILI|nr:hypothetical protein SteCoe_17830 [Stentor coeruleus]
MSHFSIVCVASGKTLIFLQQKHNFKKTLQNPLILLFLGKGLSSTVAISPLCSVLFEFSTVCPANSSPSILSCCPGISRSFNLISRSCENFTNNCFA